jgi:hypothetical protein
VALLSGFSSNLLKIFMEDPDSFRKEMEGLEIVDKDGSTTTVEKDTINPIDVMMKAIMKKSFDGLQVID